MDDRWCFIYSVVCYDHYFWLLASPSLCLVHYLACFLLYVVLLRAYCFCSPLFLLITCLRLLLLFLTAAYRCADGLFWCLLALLVASFARLITFCIRLK